MQVSATGYLPQSQNVTISTGNASTLNLALSPLQYALGGTVIDHASGQPLPNVAISAGGTHTTMTNAQGAYLLSGLSAGAVTVSFTLANYTPATCTTTLVNSGTSTLNVALYGLGGVSGTVTDAASGLALVGAQVTLASQTVSTDTLGHYAFTDLPVGAYLLSVSNAGYLSASVDVTLAVGATSTANLALTAITADLYGQLTDAASGAPLANVALSLDGVPAATTDSSGNYAVAVVAAGTHTLTATLTGYASATRTVTCTTGGRTQANIALFGQGTVSGVVTDALSTLPLGGAQVSIGTLSATTDGTGAYTLANVCTGPANLCVSAPGYLPVTQPLTVATGQTTTANVALAAANGLTGTVADALTGAPLAGAVVAAGTVNTITDAQGHYALALLQAGALTVTATLANYAAGTQTITLPSTGTVTLNFALVGQGSLAGTVTDAVSGTPLAGATVTVGTQQTSTNTAGQYAFTNLPAGGATLTVALSGYQTLAQGISLSAGAALSVNCALPPANAQCDGQVTDDATGAPIANATVTLAGQQCLTDSQGHYALSNLPTGTQTLTVTQPAYLEHHAHRQPGGGDRAAARSGAERVRRSQWPRQRCRHRPGRGGSRRHRRRGQHDHRCTGELCLRPTGEQSLPGASERPRVSAAVAGGHHRPRHCEYAEPDVDAGAICAGRRGHRSHHRAAAAQCRRQRRHDAHLHHRFPGELPDHRARGRAGDGHLLPGGLYRRHR